MMNWQHGVAKCFLMYLLCFPGLLVSSTKRDLSEEFFVLYEPVTTVTDHAAIDLDQKAIEAELAKGTPEGNQAALNVYRKGAFSKSYAELTLQNLDNGLPVAIPKDTTMFGQTSGGVEVRGDLLEDVPKGSSMLKFRYHASSVQSMWTNCHVGGNPDPNTEGCLSPTGKIEIDSLGMFDYQYDILSGNRNERSFQELSTSAEAKMYQCDEGCPYPTYTMFYAYYSVHDYGDEWIQTAFTNLSTSFLNGNAQFGSYKTQSALAKAISKGTIYLNLWMYVIKEMEHASALCPQQQEFNEDMLHSWDKAVAFYVGSQAKVAGAKEGFLLYSMAQKRGLNFGTYITDGANKDMATVNFEILMAFRQGQQSLLSRDCDIMKKQVEFISKLMTVPIIQGVLRYAYRDQNVQPLDSDALEKEQAEGATYAAALLPLLHACNETDATIVYEEMKVGKVGPPNFSAVKAALERNYACLGVTCEYIGGLVDAVKVDQYMPGAEPCASNYMTGASPTKSTTDTTGPNVGLAVGLSVFFVVALLGISVILGRKKSTNNGNFDGAAPYSDSMEMT